MDEMEAEEELSPKDIARKEQLKVALVIRLQREEADWRQKSRAKWIKEGDRNMGFFHCMTSHYRRWNYLETMDIEEREVQSNEDLR